jgi:hypothetical protein
MILGLLDTELRGEGTVVDLFFPNIATEHAGRGGLAVILNWEGVRGWNGPALALISPQGGLGE